MGRRKKNKLPQLKVRQETILSITAIFLIAMGLLVVVSFSGQGVLLQLVNDFLRSTFGFSSLILPFVFISAGLVLFQTKWAITKPNTLLGTIIVMGASLVLFRQGSLGQDTFANISDLISVTGTYIVFATFLLIGLMIMVQISIKEMAEMFAVWNEKRKESQEEVVEGPELVTEDDIKAARGFSLPKLSLPFSKKADAGFSVNDKVNKLPSGEDEMATAVVSKSVIPTDPAQLSEDATTNQTPMIWEYPPLSLLSPSRGGEANRGNVKENAGIIENTLESFGIAAKVVEVNCGPAVTQYALQITRGTKLSRITNLTTDLALSLAAPTGQVRIEAPIAGRSLVGIEVPNHSAQYVTMRTMLTSDAMKKEKSKLAVALGINVSGEPIVADIAKMPHVLIAGATGSGKSVAVNSFLCSMLFRASPAEVKFILVDPKRVELTGYNDIPHLLTPVIVDPAKVVSALKWATQEMDNRYKKLAEVGVKNIDGYNEISGFAAMPSIVIVIDELADIMLFAPSEVEESVTRLAQMARAVGIHLVLATQRPSVDVITGLIKANVPTRIAFNVSSMTDSRVILDSPGAEKLLGRGDMLYIPPTQSKPTRIQGTFVSDSEAKQLIDFLKSQGQRPEYQEEITSKFKASKIRGGSSGGGIDAGGDGEDRDDLFVESVKLVAQYDKASSSLIQRRFKVGYARAARILDQLYEAGLVSAPDGSKPREVYNAKVAEFLGSLQGIEE